MGLNVVMMGPPGAGKGTQAARVAAARGLLRVSTGDILREAVKARVPSALDAKAKMDRGELVDDATIIEIVRERLMRADAAAGFVFDGFPRTVAQAVALDEIMGEGRRGPLVVVNVAVSEGELVRRLAGRRICSQCGVNASPSDGGGRCGRCGGALEQRTDDSEHVVRARLAVYERATHPVLEFYRARPTFRVVNGGQTLERVAHDLDAMIDDVVLSEATVKTGLRR